MQILSLMGLVYGQRSLFHRLLSHIYTGLPWAPSERVSLGSTVLLPFPSTLCPSTPALYRFHKALPLPARLQGWEMVDAIDKSLLTGYPAKEIPL